MKRNFKTPVIVIVFICAVLCAESCKKAVPPSVTTANVSAITQTSATSGGNVTSDGGEDVIARGVCWNTSADPTISNSKTSDGTGIGTFTSTLSQLTPGNTYYLRAYATNEAGTGYGNQVTFTTNAIVLTTVATTGVTVTGTTAVVSGYITSDGGASVTARGICWGTTANPTVEGNKTSEGSGTGSFSSTITGLSHGVTYHARAYATNSAGVAYGDDKIFSASGGAPTVRAEEAAYVTSTEARLQGYVDPNYISTEVTFEFGTTDSYGQTFTAVNSPLSGSGENLVYVDITDLTPATTYHFRVRAVNSSGEAYGEDRTFTTSGGAPTVRAEEAAYVTSTEARLQGYVDPNYISTEVTFEFGTTDSYGQTFTAVNSPLSGSGENLVYVDITDLTPATTYHFRVRAVNSSGEAYGEDRTFTTSGGR